MPNNEKELNCYLLDQLELIERLEIIAQNGSTDEILNQLALEKKICRTKVVSKTTTYRNRIAAEVTET